MEEKIRSLIEAYVKDFSKRTTVNSQWQQPIVKYANAKDLDFKKLKKSVDVSHLMPEDLLKNANTIITYFIPFEESIPESNKSGKNSSEEWAIAYIETNQLIGELNQHVIKYLENEGYKGLLIPATHNFNEETLISQWSHRHIAEIAGLGTFGLNNMLITKSGCCGRIGSIVTTVCLKTSKKIEEEYCLYKINGSCGICMNRCKFGALTLDGYNRERCYEVLLENDQYHSDLGITDVCGKCCIDLPCSFRNPENLYYEK